jgi:cytochrome c-type biogenesis protein
MISLHLFVASAALVSGVQLTLAFGAGVLAAFNPCGFALLPAYISYVVSHQERQDAPPADAGWGQALRGGVVGLPVAGGFLGVFLVAGGILALSGRLIVTLFPWLTLVVGAGLVLLGGGLLLSGRTLEMPGLARVATVLGRIRTQSLAASPATGMAQEWRAAWLFGLGYGVASLGCTLPIFLLVVGSAATVAGWGGAVLVLSAYGAGMVLVVLAVALLAATFRDVLRRYVTPALRWVQPLGSLLVLAAGVYIIIHQLLTWV